MLVLVVGLFVLVLVVGCCCWVVGLFVLILLVLVLEDLGHDQSWLVVGGVQPLLLLLVVRVLLGGGCSCFWFLGVGWLVEAS